MISMLEKQLVSFDRFNNTDTIDKKIEETSSFRMLILSFFSKFEMSFFIISIAKTASQRIGAVIRSIFFLLRLLCISINLPYGLA